MVMFILKESIKSITSAKLSSVLSLVAAVISIFIISVVILLLGFSNSIEEKIKERITFTMFLPDSSSEEQIDQIKSEISEFGFVRSVSYITKQQAEENFIKQTGEDFKGILDYNPLPASFEIKIKPDYLTDEKISYVETRLKRVKNIDEVVIQKDFIITLLRWLSTIKLYLMIVGVILFLIALYLVFSMNKIIINNKTPQIETMKLVGAKNSSIKLPIILNGLIIGVLASIICIICYRLIILAFNVEMKDFFFSSIDSMIFIVIILLSGIILGFLGSVLAVGKISIKIKKITF